LRDFLTTGQGLPLTAPLANGDFPEETASAHELIIIEMENACAKIRRTASQFLAKHEYRFPKSFVPSKPAPTLRQAQGERIGH
jgi:hypothetical protein